MAHGKASSRGTDRISKQRHVEETWARNPHKLLEATTVSAEGDARWYLYCWLTGANVIWTSGEMMMMMMTTMMMKATTMMATTLRPKRSQLKYL